MEAAIAEMPAGRLNFVPFDLFKVDVVPDLIREMKAEHGPLYGLVNNAALGTDGLLSNMHNSDIEKLVRLNTVSPIVLTKYAMRAMMAAGEGRIVNISSIVGFTGYSGLSVYGATKASMLGFTAVSRTGSGPAGRDRQCRGAGLHRNRDDRKHDATISVTRSPRRAALKRLVDAEDVANAVSFLMSDAARNITGTVMTVDAGNTA